MAKKFDIDCKGATRRCAIATVCDAELELLSSVSTGVRG